MLKSKSFLLSCVFFYSLLNVQALLAIGNENQITNGSIEQPLTQTLSSDSLISSETKSNQVIINSENHTSQVSLNELRAIFSLRARQWPDGHAINVFVLGDDHPAHKDFVLKTLKMLPHQLRRHWDRYIYTGIGQGPVVLKSESEMIEQVKLTPGSIGYIKGGVSDASVHLLSIE